MTKLGFVGLGNMGRPMCRRLLAAGQELLVFDVDREAVALLEREGATGAPSAAALADQAETVFTSLPSPSILTAVALGDQGLHEGDALRRVVDLSTVGAGAAARVAKELAEQSIAYVDAPVSGGVSGAAAGSLAVMVAASRSDLDLVRPLLEVLGSKIFEVGDEPGLGQVMKLANNYLSATAIAATSEALAVGVKAGLDPTLMVEVINSGSGKNTATEVKFPRHVLPGTFDAGFTLGGMYKDVRLFTEEAEDEGVPIFVGSAVRHLWQFGVAQLGPDEDMTALAKSVEAWAGVELRASDGPGD
jgi:3-hydroxyisobutyrate dehydrogenase-like beta-hydroxyacid dehydrogenase